MLAVVLRAIVIMPAIPPVIAPTVSVSSPRFTAVKTASFLYFSASPFHSGSAPFWLLFLAPFFCSYVNMLNFSRQMQYFFYFFCILNVKKRKPIRRRLIWKIILHTAKHVLKKLIA